jgi:hypothetical protein
VADEPEIYIYHRDQLKELKENNSIRRHASGGRGDFKA